VATIPSSKDFFNPETRSLMEKYLGGKAGIPTEDRLRAINLVKDLSSVYLGGLTLHAEGSLSAQRLSIYAIADFESMDIAKKAIDMLLSGSEHPTVYRYLEREMKRYHLNRRVQHE
jgi:4-hydroxybutyryl-CoA dehydratase/vinylacetyl-CoA-Delta-isomerase